MRTPKVFLTGLLLAGLTGCGTAAAAGQTPSWVAAPAGASPSISPSASPDETADGLPADPEEEASVPPADPADEASEPPADPQHQADPVQPGTTTPTEKPEPPQHAGPHGDGPAESLRRTGKAAVALTFDDGPDPVQTPQLLDLLAEHHVKATFCLVGENVVAYPDLVRRIAAEGHTLCNHTWRHSLTLGTEKPAVIRADLQRTNDAIRQAVPEAQIRYMRAPGGNFTDRFVAVATDLGMTSIYWQVDPRDWDHPEGETGEEHVAKVVDRVRQHVSKGAIVLSHDYRQPDTITAYEQLLPWLTERYRLIALP
jgi:peptidoglycan/xylan/chitin deacetylase (PgdA/CDA1 family)